MGGKRNKEALASVRMVRLTIGDVEALVHTIDDVSRMASLDDDGGPRADEVRQRAIDVLRRLTNP